MNGPSTIRVKICGITNEADAIHAANCGADALGFVFYKESPRNITPGTAAKIIKELPPFLTTVGLFVTEQPEKINQVVEFCGLNTIQLHGDEKPEQCFYERVHVIKALRLRDDLSDQHISSFQVSALLLDAYVTGSYGGTGHCCNWERAEELSSFHRIILAGGLAPQNVIEAIRKVRPYGVDVSTGVESSPGQKDPEKVATFIKRARKALL